MRKLHINDEEWQYKIGKSGAIVIFPPNGRKVLTDASEVSGLSWDEVERGTWKGWFHLKPSMIKDWIIKNELESQSS
jgi:hypothetical protein